MNNRNFILLFVTKQEHTVRGRGGRATLFARSGSLRQDAAAGNVYTG